MNIHIRLEDLKYRGWGEYQIFSFRPDFGSLYLLNTAPQCCVFEIERLIPDSIWFSSPTVNNNVAPENRSSDVIFFWHYRYDMEKIRDFYSRI